MSKKVYDSFSQALAHAPEAKVNKLFKEVAAAVVGNLKLRRTLCQIDNQLDKLGEEADPSHPFHKLYVSQRKKLDVLEAKRNKLNSKLRIYGIDLR